MPDRPRPRDTPTGRIYLQLHCDRFCTKRNPGRLELFVRSAHGDPDGLGAQARRLAGVRRRVRHRGHRQPRPVLRIPAQELHPACDRVSAASEE